jgi:hypothetical protein
MLHFAETSTVSIKKQAYRHHYYGGRKLDMKKHANL